MLFTMNDQWDCDIVSRVYECQTFSDMKGVTVLRDFLKNLVDRPSWSSSTFFIHLLSCTFLGIHALVSLKKCCIFPCKTLYLSWSTTVETLKKAGWHFVSFYLWLVNFLNRVNITQWARLVYRSGTQITPCWRRWNNSWITASAVRLNYTRFIV